MGESDYSVRDELEMKVSNALVRILTDRRDGICSRSQASYALRILFDSISGLVPKDLFNMITQASEEIAGDHKDAITRLLVDKKAGALVAISYTFGDTELNVTRGNFPGPFTTKRLAFMEENPFEAAHLRLDAYAERLKERGFEEVPLC